MGEQGHDDHDRLCQSAQPIEDGAFASAEGFVTRMTDEAPLLLRMDTNIALAGLASSRAMPVGAACGCRVHDSPPGFVWKQAKRSMLPPHFRYKCASPRLSAELPVQQLIESFYAKYRVVELGTALLLKASALREQYAFSFWDSLIVSSALHTEAAVLYSEDMQDGLVVENRVRIINP